MTVDPRIVLLHGHANVVPSRIAIATSHVHEYIRGARRGRVSGTSTRISSRTATCWTPARTGNAECWPAASSLSVTATRSSDGSYQKSSAIAPLTVGARYDYLEMDRSVQLHGPW